MSQSGRSYSFHGMRLLRNPIRGNPGNYYDPATGLDYWVSGPKREGGDRHPYGKGPIELDADAADAYARHRATGRR